MLMGYVGGGGEEEQNKWDVITTPGLYECNRVLSPFSLCCGWLVGWFTRSLVALCGYEVSKVVSKWYDV